VINKSEAREISSRFAAYEHEYRFFSGYLGEPFLFRDCILYFDGEVLNVPAFTLRNSSARFDLQSINDFLDEQSIDVSPRLVHVWGDFFPKPMLVFGENRLDLFNHEDVQIEHEGEYTIDIRTFDPAATAELRKTIRKVRESDLRCIVSKVDELTWRQLSLISNWTERLKPGTAGGMAGASIAGFVRSNDCYVVSAILNNQVVGFSVFSLPDSVRAVNLMSFSLRIEKLRIDDALAYRTIQHCDQLGVKRVHLGYSGSESLSRFKRKWGARQTGASYRQAIYTAGEKWTQHADDFSFFWLPRLLSNS
jgi:hypothetical protein